MKFWEPLGKSIILGVHENSTSCTRFPNCLCLDSSKSKKQHISVMSKFMIDPVYEDVVQQPKEYHQRS